MTQPRPAPLPLPGPDAIRPWVCPLCQGMGKVDTWRITRLPVTTMEECPTCNGERIVWGPPATEPQETR